MNRIKIIITTFFVLFSFFGMAQKMKYSTKNKKAIIAFEKGRNHFDLQRDNLALEELEKALKEDPDFIEAHTLYAQIKCYRKDYDVCIQSYEKAIAIDPQFWSANYFNLSNAYLKIGEYQKAVDNVDIYLKSKDLSPMAIKRAQQFKKNAEFGAWALKNPVPYDPKNLGESINTDYSEYWPTISADNQTLIYTRTVNIGSETKPVIKEDFFIAKKGDDGNWKKGKNVGPPINTRGNEGALALSPDGQFVFFVACDRSDGKGSCDLYVAKKSGDLWMKPLNLGASVNTSKWESSPSFSSDGKTLFYSSSRTGGKGRMDLWTTSFDGKRWSKPQNIKELNTPYDELAPFIHPDGNTLYFVSGGFPGMGGADIFYARKQPNGSWGKPTNMGYPINTAQEERGLVVNTDGSLAYIVSEREGGFGEMDIYTFELYEEARPQKVTYAKGKVYDMFSNLPLGASFELIDIATHEVIVKSSSNDKSGEFLVCLPVNKDYALNVSKEGYLFYSENFSLTNVNNTNEPYLLDVPLQPLKAGGTVVLKNVFFNTAKFDLVEKSQAELNKLVKFLDNAPTSKIEIGGHTDNVGNKSDNQVLSENRAKSVYDYLISKGIAADRLSFKGYGDEKPITTNDTPEGRQQNRRTEFKIISL